MVSEEKAKTASLVLSVAVLLLVPVKGIGLYQGCSILERMLYVCFHANFFHAICNAWCLLSLVFVYRCSLAEVLVAYIIAIAYPFAGVTPIVGMSGMCFALMGVIYRRIQRKRMYLVCVLALLAVGLLFANVAVALHTFCFAVGIVWSLLNTPIQWKR